MKKTALLSLAASSLIAGTAMAQSANAMMVSQSAPVAIPHAHHSHPGTAANTFRPFVGVNYSYLAVDRSKNAQALSDSYNGVNLDAGVKYGKYVGMAFGWTHFFGEDLYDGVSGMTDRPEMFYAEIRGYYPIMDSGFDLIGSVGAGLLDHQNGLNNSTSSLNMRAGLGADYHFTHNWSVQFMAHFNPSHQSSDQGFSNFWDMETGLYYTFS